jgi:putative exporter of polyketide antibiotics
MFAAVAVMTGIIAAGFAIGAASSGSDALTPLVGTLALGLFALAATGAGLAIGGVFRTSVAAEIVALLVVVTYLIDLLAPLFKLPDWVHQLALSSQMGRPMIGEWELVGVVASLALALGGMGLGAWGISRRDVES